MTTVTVKDANGDNVDIDVAELGRATAVASKPVVLANEDLAAINAITAAFGTTTFYPPTQPVSAASLPLPSGAATSAKQDALAGLVGEVQASPTSNTVLDRLKTIASALAGTIAVSGTFWQATQPVSAASLPLPSGAATSAKQDTLAALVGEVQASPTSNTLLDRVKALLTGIVLAAGTNIIGKVGIDQTTDGTTNKVNIDASLKSGTATRSSVNSGTSSATILASNANRKGATIFNSDANALLLDLSGGTAAATRCQVRLVQYQSYEVGAGFTGAITGIWEGDGSGIADVVEFT